MTMEETTELPPLSRLDQLAVNAYVRSIQAGMRTINEVLVRLQLHVAVQLETANANT